jgi:hypothetical protein
MITTSALVLSMTTMALVAPAAHGDDMLTTVTTVTAVSPDGACPLRRLGDRLVRCDSLTGAGVTAPVGVPSL